MICFGFMRPHTIDSPLSRSKTSRYIMAFHDASLPIQHNGRAGTPRTGESNIKKCVCCQSGAGNVGGVRRTCSDNTGGGYTNVIPIPVDDPATKAIAGALFKPDGAGPFPAVVYMSGCEGLRRN